MSALAGGFVGSGISLLANRRSGYWIGDQVRSNLRQIKNNVNEQYVNTAGQIIERGAVVSATLRKKSETLRSEAKRSIEHANNGVKNIQKAFVNSFLYPKGTAGQN